MIFFSYNILLLKNRDLLRRQKMLFIILDKIHFIIFFSTFLIPLLRYLIMTFVTLI